MYIFKLCLEFTNKYTFPIHVLTLASVNTDFNKNFKTYFVLNYIFSWPMLQLEFVRPFAHGLKVNSCL